MHRSSLILLVVGLVVGALATGGIDASALAGPDDPSREASALVAEIRAAAAKTASPETSSFVKERSSSKKGSSKHGRSSSKRKHDSKKHGSSSKKQRPKRKSKKNSKKHAPAPTVAPAATSTPLVGLFRVTPGSYANGRASGSYIRLVLAGGSRDRGPFFPNPNSKGGTFTLLSPGTDGGLRTGAYQPAPAPPFGPLGDARADRIITPQRFAFIHYSVQTSAKDPQTGVDVPTPKISATPDGKLAGELQAFAAQWNKQSFNVGSPKPDGALPGLTTPVSGTFDANTHAYTLDWASQIVGGPFNNFTAVWHFEGTFEPGCA